MDRAIFFDQVRHARVTVSGKSWAIFPGGLTQEAVTGMTGILDAFARYGDGRIETLAYGLATARREVGADMSPVREGFKTTDAAARAHVAGREYGKPAGPYGHVYYGRGTVQMTWLENYEASSKDAGVDLVKNPDAALDPLIASKLLFLGLIDGRWNGQRKGIAHYLPAGSPYDLKNARRTVNITDHWQEVAAYFVIFLKALLAAGGVPREKPAEKSQEARPAQPAAPARPAPPTPPAAAPAGTTQEKSADPTKRAARSLLGTLAALLLAGLAAALGLSASTRDASPAAFAYCAPLDTIVTRLAQKFAERPVAGGKTGDGNAVTVFASPDGATFTVVMVAPSGLACAMTAGSGWTLLGDPT